VRPDKKNPSCGASRVKSIIFDLDGTLLNTLDDIGHAMNCVLMKRGYPTHALDMYRFFIGDGLEKLIERTLPEHVVTRQEVLAALDDFRFEYAKNCDQTTRPYPGISELLHYLTANGVQLAVLSNKAQVFTERLVDNLLASWDFYPVLGSNDRFPKKPDPSAALYILKEQGLDAGECLFMGDSGVDMKTAAAAGIFSVGAGWGFRPMDELLNSGCRFLAEHPMDVLSLLARPL